MKNFFLSTAVLLLAFSPVSLASDRQLIDAVCQTGKPKCVELVIRAMKQRYQPLAKQCDHDALFALAYLRTTQTFLKTIDEINYNNPASVIREDALFANYYFRAYDAYHTGQGYVPPVWQIAFDAAQHRSVSGSGNLILGFNAHIQRDLPFVLYELYLKGHPVSYEDHTRVNEFLQQVNILPEIARKFDPTVDDEDIPGNADDLQRFQLIAQWREGAYRNFERLRDANTNTQRIQIAAEIEAQTAATAFLLQQNYSYPPGIDSSERDTYCQAQRKQR